MVRRPSVRPGPSRRRLGSRRPRGRLKAKGDLGPATLEFREAIRLKPDIRLAHVELADCLFKQGKPAEASAALREAVRLNPDDAATHVNLGITLDAQGKLSDAAAAYCEAIQLMPGSVVAHKALANVLERQGKAEEAAAQRRLAMLETTPDVPSASSGSPGRAQPRSGLRPRPRREQYPGKILPLHARRLTFSGGSPRRGRSTPATIAPLVAPPGTEGRYLPCGRLLPVSETRGVERAINPIEERAGDPFPQEAVRDAPAVEDGEPDHGGSPEPV